MTRRRLSTAIMLTLSLSLTACSAKPSADTTETSTEATTDIKEETDASTTDAGTSSNDADTSSNDVAKSKVTEPSTEEETLSESEETEEEESTEEETEDDSSPEESTRKSGETDEETTSAKKTSSKETTKASEVTVQSVSASVSGTHYVGETLSGSDFTVVVTMSDGSTKTNPDGWSASPLTLTSTSNLITVSYEGASVTITVEASVAETTAAVASNTTTTTTTKAETTQAATAQATTAATTAAATTTAAETTTASGVEWVEWADGDWNYALAQALFIAQNEMRAEARVDALIWDDQMYETAKLCAKVCGDNGVIDHTLTGQYRQPAYRTAYTGETIEVGYSENLEITVSRNVKTDDVSWYADKDTGDATGVLRAIKNSSAHYKTAIGDGLQYGAIAVYKMGNSAYISYLFYDNDDFWLGESFIW